MNELFELLPLVFGVAIGLLCHGMAAGRRRVLVLAVLSVIGGLAATLISGEYRESWGYLLLDIPLTAGMAAATLLTPRAIAALTRTMRS